MTYKNYKIALLFRVLLLTASLTALAFAINYSHFYGIIGASLVGIIAFYNLYTFTARRFVEMDDFFESMKYKDFSRKFAVKSGPRDIRELHKGFNMVNATVREINSKKEAQFVYLQKILEMVDVGILAYNMESGDVLWANDTIHNTLNFPSFKNVRFVANRRPELYKAIFESSHHVAATITLDLKYEKIKALISDSVFHVEDDSFKLILLQNIDETLDQNESDSWKKLLSVMTHEIMNSIAPITSLAGTLESHIQQSIASPENYPLEIEDLHEGIQTIKKRSEGLMKFAKTYRSLNKVTHLNLSSVPVSELFRSIDNLMQPSIQNKAITIDFTLKNPDLKINIDTYLIEQVLINLILNAIDACSHSEQPSIELAAEKNVNGNTILSVTDNGTGIPAEILDQIFVPFFSTKKKGSGIGLSLCKQIMLLHKGKINIQSKEGVGTAISLVF